MQFIHLGVVRRMNQVGLAPAAIQAVPAIRLVIVKTHPVLTHHLAVATRLIANQDVIQGSLDLSCPDLVCIGTIFYIVDVECSCSY